MKNRSKSHDARFLFQYPVNLEWSYLDMYGLAGPDTRRFEVT
jgi:hypothetical protein